MTPNDPSSGIKTQAGSKRMKLLQVANAVRYRTMTTEELRQAFLIGSLFQAGKLDVIYTDLDRTVIVSRAE